MAEKQGMEDGLGEMLHRGRRISYRFVPSQKRSAPLLVILHGHTHNARPSRYRNPKFHILCPIDDFGVESAGSWFLGEGGDFFWIEAMRELIGRLAPGANTYFWGSSMGGYGAILHGALNDAKCVYANIPQTWLIGSDYANGGMDKFFRPIFGAEVDPEFNDLRNVVRRRLRTTFFLSFNVFDRKNYVSQQCMRFCEALLEGEKSFYLEMRPAKGHTLTHSVQESVELFERFDPV